MDEKDSWTDHEFDFDYEEDEHKRELRSRRMPDLMFVIILLIAIFFA